jgi:signal transduction histidine kinase
VERKQLHVLLIEDNPADAKLTRRALEASENPTYRIDDVPSLGEAAIRLGQTPYDAVLLDLGLPESVGVDAVAQFRALCPFPPPLIVLTAHDDQRVALEALDQGAQEYIIKSDIVCLSRSIRHAIVRQQMMQELNTANEMLQGKNVRLAELYDSAQQFVDNVSHEFRTPLTVIREFTSIVRDGCAGPVTPNQIEYLDKVLNRSDDLAHMIDDMLDISKLESGRLGVWRRPYKVAEMITTVIGSLEKRAESKNIRLTRNVEPDLPQVFCDEEKAQRVLINLAVNAIKFTPDGGQVEIWARPATDGAEIVVGVTDSGPGISAENLEIVFERFRQLGTNMRASTKGFGLGLNIAKELVNLNLGKMNVESDLGKGSTFSFTLPCNDHTVVFERYAERIVALADSLSELSFVTASIDSESSKSVVVAMDEYLQRAVRSHDLVIQTSGHTWLVAASCAERDVSAAIDRLNSGWQEYARNCPNVELPELHLTPSGTWPLSAGLSRLREEFRTLIDGRATKRPLLGTVLVVDDDQEVSACLGVRLQLVGYEVLKAFDGQEGLAATIKHHPDAVVLDIRMPKMDGITVLREIRSNESVRRTPVVVLSANIRDQHLALEAGANFFVSKPYEAGAVLSAIESSMSTAVNGAGINVDARN